MSDFCKLNFLGATMSDSTDAGGLLFFYHEITTMG